MADATQDSYVRRDRQEFTEDTTADFFQDYCMTCVKHKACGVQIHLQNNVGNPTRYWHPTLIALTRRAVRQEEKNMVVCSSYMPTMQTMLINLGLRSLDEPIFSSMSNDDVVRDALDSVVRD